MLDFPAVDSGRGFVADFVWHGLVGLGLGSGEALGAGDRLGSPLGDQQKGQRNRSQYSAITASWMLIRIVPKICPLTQGLGDVNVLIGCIKGNRTGYTPVADSRHISRGCPSMIDGYKYLEGHW